MIGVLPSCILLLIAVGSWIFREEAEVDVADQGMSESHELA